MGFDLRLPTDVLNISNLARLPPVLWRSMLIPLFFSWDFHDFRLRVPMLASIGDEAEEFCGIRFINLVNGVVNDLAARLSPGEPIYRRPSALILAMTNTIGKGLMITIIISTVIIALRLCGTTQNVLRLEFAPLCGGPNKRRAAPFMSIVR